MTKPTYPAARVVATKVQHHFSRLHGMTGAAGDEDRPPIPALSAIEALIDGAFWASLRREEGYAPRISLALMGPDRAQRPLLFERPLTLTAAAIAKLAPAVERPSIHLGVWAASAEDQTHVPEGGERRDALRIWGTTWTVPPLTVVLEVIAPGLLVVKHRRSGESSKFANVAVLEGDEVKVLEQGESGPPDCPKVLTSLFGFDSPTSWVDSSDVMVPLAVSMRAHGRGGTLLVVPADTDRWRSSIIQPLPYAVAPPFSELAELVRGARETERLSHAVEAMAGLTAVDGATVMTDRYELLAFGAKIARLDDAPVERVMVTEPVEGCAPVVAHTVQLGGTRHLSAAQFVHDQRDAVALVASQDGRFTVFTWSPDKHMVHAHRVETLLL